MTALMHTTSHDHIQLHATTSQELIRRDTTYYHLVDLTLLSITNRSVATQYCDIQLTTTRYQYLCTRVRLLVLPLSRCSGITLLAMRSPRTTRARLSRFYVITVDA